MFIIMQMKKEIDNLKEVISKYHVNSNNTTDNSHDINRESNNLIAIENKKETVNQETPYIIDNDDKKEIGRQSTPNDNKKEKEITYIDDITEIEEQPITLAEQEKRMILETYKKTKSNLKETAEILGVSTRTIYRKLEEYGIDTKNHKK